MAAIDRADVVVAGGGPAGLVTAIEAARAGCEVIVLERSQPPIDRACGEGLMPDGAACLEAIGLQLGSVIGRPFHGVRYIDGELTAEGRFHGPPGWGIRRTVLHGALCDLADGAGIDIRWGVRVLGLSADGFETSHGPVGGRYLIGADGRNSFVRRQAGMDGGLPKRRRFAVRRHFAVEPWTDLVEVYWVDGAEAYVTPVGEREVGVACMWSGEGGGFDATVARLPMLRAWLGDAPPSSVDRGAGPLEQKCRTVVRANLALVGDASGYLDAISGEGLAMAFRQARAVVDAIVEGDLRRYERSHRRIVRHPVAMTRLMLKMADWPRARRRVMRALREDATLMSRFLALKMNEDGPRYLGADGLLNLTWSALKP